MGVHTEFGDEDTSIVGTRVYVPSGHFWCGAPDDLQILEQLVGIQNVSLRFCDEDYLAELIRLDVTPNLEACVSDEAARRGILSASAIRLPLSEMQKLSAVQLSLPLIRKETLTFLPLIPRPSGRSNWSCLMMQTQM